MITLEEGITPGDLEALYADPLIARTGYDRSPAAPVSHPLARYLSARVDGKFVGAYLVIECSDFEYEVHTYLLRESVRHSRELGALLIEWVFSHSSVLRLTGLIPENIHSALNHAVKMGFKYEGFRRDAIMIDGEPKGIHMVGITRRDWSESWAASERKSER